MFEWVGIYAFFFYFLSSFLLLAFALFRSVRFFSSSLWCDKENAMQRFNDCCWRISVRWMSARVNQKKKKIEKKTVTCPMWIGCSVNKRLHANDDCKLWNAIDIAKNTTTKKKWRKMVKIFMRCGVDWLSQQQQYIVLGRVSRKRKVTTSDEMRLTGIFHQMGENSSTISSCVDFSFSHFASLFNLVNYVLPQLNAFVSRIFSSDTHSAPQCLPRVNWDRRHRRRRRRHRSLTMSSFLFVNQFSIDKHKFQRNKKWKSKRMSFDCCATHFDSLRNVDVDDKRSWSCFMHLCICLFRFRRKRKHK